MKDNSEQPSPAPVFVLIEKRDVERKNFDELMRALDAMAHSAGSTREYGGRLELVFGGYENDRRELHEINEVRDFVQALTARFPYWFHFCYKSGDSLMMLIQCLLPVAPVTVTNGVASTALDTAAWNKKTMELFGYMNGLYEHHGLTQEENSATTKEVLQYVRSFQRA